MKIKIRMAIVFAAAFVLNVIWEFAHSVLYKNYQGGEIIPIILLRAAFFDALMILLLVSISWKLRKENNWLLLLGGFILAIAIEKWALQTGRWEYAPVMPIIPVLKVGLTPALQLALTGLLSSKIAYFFKRR